MLRDRGQMLRVRGQMLRVRGKMLRVRGQMLRVRGQRSTHSLSDVVCCAALRGAAEAVGAGAEWPAGPAGAAAAQSAGGGDCSAQVHCRHMCIYSASLPVLTCSRHTAPPHRPGLAATPVSVSAVPHPAGPQLNAALGPEPGAMYQMAPMNSQKYARKLPSLTSLILSPPSSPHLPPSSHLSLLIPLPPHLSPPLTSLLPSPPSYSGPPSIPHFHYRWSDQLHEVV